jgi:2-iminobutanoate/2-iminopropanoate deaminase
MAHFKTLNEIYAGYVPEPYPARSALAVKELPLGAEVEIEAIAMIKK